MFILLVTLFICAFIVSSFRESFSIAISRKKVTSETYVPFLLLAIVIVPILLMNTFFSDRTFSSPQEMIDFGERYENEEILHEGIEKRADYNRNNVLEQLSFLHYYFDGHLGSFTCEISRKRYNREQTSADKIARLYVTLRCKPEKVDEIEITRLDFKGPGVNYVKGKYFEVLGGDKKALKHYNKEILISPDFSLSYRRKAQILRKTNKSEFDQFMLDQATEDHLPYFIKEGYYYNHGHWKAYLANIFMERVVRTPWLVVLIAFVVSFIWMFYLRLMDFYNREKWLNVLFAFLLGGLFTNFCLPIYDLFRYEVGFHLNGEAFNDFWYCTVVIGGSEELVKFVPWLIFGFIFGKLKEPFDYILYASVSALGFAFVENFAYLQDFGNISSRAITSTVAHMFFAVIVAYSFIVAKFRMRSATILKKIGVIVCGFIVAMLAHGFYDFWLISSSVAGFEFLTLLFFVFSLHVWFYFKRNAMNHSPFFKGNERFNVKLQKEALYIGVVSVVMLQYIVIGLDFGAKQVNHFFYREAGYAGVFLFYVTSQLNNFKLAKGVWHKFSLKNSMPIKRLGQIFSRISSFNFFSQYNWQNSTQTHADSHIDLRGLELRLFAPKSNKYIGSKLPVSGYCSKHITVNGEKSWYIFRLNTPIHYSTYLADKILIKSKSDKKSLLDDKIEIYFMFIPSESVLSADSIMINQLRYAGRSYSRPLNRENYI